MFISRSAKGILINNAKQDELEILYTRNFWYRWTISKDHKILKKLKALQWKEKYITITIEFVLLIFQHQMLSFSWALTQILICSSRIRCNKFRFLQGLQGKGTVQMKANQDRSNGSRRARPS